MTVTSQRRVGPSLSDKPDAVASYELGKKFQRESSRWRHMLIGVYNLALWCFIVTVVLSQFLAIVSDSTSSITRFVYGQSPLLGTFAISGDNDEPYSDRMIVCKLRGRLYRPAQLSAVLGESSAILTDSSGSAISGYRVVQRHTAQLDEAAYAAYSSMCDELAGTLDAILDSCVALGYNVTRDNLRVVDGIHSTNTFLIPNSLPILVMPYWDNSPYSHFMIPGWDGSACAFRLTGRYFFQKYSVSMLHAPDRSVRESKTAEWLQRPGGMWRNGWYEDPTGTAWYSDMATTDPQEPYGVNSRQFDTITNQELNSSSHPLNSVNLPSTTRWGEKLSVTDTAQDMVSIVISNGFRYGLFIYENSPIRVVRCVYDLETFISNTSVAMLLFRWMLVMWTLQSSYRRRKCRKLETAGIGCLSNSRTFLLLPIALTPRLKQTLTAFFTTGCLFESEQVVFAEAWFVIYPGIVEFLLLYYSLLNLLARMLRRRMTDALFGPTLIFLCVMHWLRTEIAQSGWFEIDGRILSAFSADEFEKATVTDFFSSDVALRINGGVRSLFAIKLVVLACSLLLLLVAPTTSVHGPTATRVPPMLIEKALAVRACCSGGLGRSSYYDTADQRDGVAIFTTLSSYELLRLGYVVLGDRYLISILEWMYFSIFAGASRREQPSSYRVLLMRVEEKPDGHEIMEAPAYYRVNDPRLHQIRFWHVGAGSFK